MHLIELRNVLSNIMLLTFLIAKESHIIHKILKYYNIQKVFIEQIKQLYCANLLKEQVDFFTRTSKNTPTSCFDLMVTSPTKKSMTYSKTLVTILRL